MIASHNPGKVREIAELLAPHGLSAVSAADLALPEPEETGTSFEANGSRRVRRGKSQPNGESGTGFSAADPSILGHSSRCSVSADARY